MQQDIINKYGKEAVQGFWIFIENLKFDSKTQDASSVRGSILKMLSPNMAEKYKDIADELAFSLYREVFYDKKTTYLYASFEAVGKGSSFYENCWDNSTLINPIVESVDQFNNFSTVLPTEDDYFNLILPSPQNVLDEFDEYDLYLESLGNKKSKKTKGNKKTQEHDE